MIDYIKDIATFNTDQFHFLRPYWLWAFIPVVVVALVILFTSQEDKKWKKVIAPALHPFMFTRGKSSSFIFPLLAFGIIMSLGILGLSGPSWQKVEVPGAKSEAVLTIALDCSLSMLAEDIQPNRLERAKFKIRDLLDANPGAQVGLFAFSGTAHTVVPFSSDYRLITHQLESLSPGIMPLQGTSFQLVMDLVDSTLLNIKAPSTLLIVSDEFKHEDAELLINFTNNSIHRVEVLAMATQTGAQIPQNENKQPVTNAEGNIVVSKLDPEILFKLQKHPKINVNSLTLDNSDMQLMAKNIRRNLIFQEDEAESEEQWKDMGYIFVILLVLILPFWFRKGWMIQYSWIPLLVLMSSCSSDLNWKDLWYTKDYQGQQYYDKENFNAAGYTFESSFHQGVAFYKAGNFDAAAQAFARDSSANSLFNLGMAYTQLGQYEEALKVIELAADKAPDNKDFQEALNETNRTLGVLDSIRNEGDLLVIPEAKEERKEKLEEQKAASKDEELSSETEVEELPDEGKRVSDEVETDQRKAEEMEEVPEDFKAGSGQTPQNILLREISADPGEFLRRRFKFQQKKYYPNLKDMNEKW